MTRDKRNRQIGLIACAAMLAAFYVLAYSAVRQKSATADEPLHAMGAYLHYFEHDFRINCEDPPLWKYWAMLPQRRDNLHVDLDAPQFKALPDYIWNGTKFVAQTMYRTPGNDPDAFINRSRMIMLVLGVALGALIATWARQIAGPVAGVIA